MNQRAAFGKRYGYRMPKYDDYPDQANAQIQKDQDEIDRLEGERDDAVERAEQLERDMDAAYAAGDNAEVERLQEQHQQAERQIQDANTDLEGAWESLRNTTEFWGLG